MRFPVVATRCSGIQSRLKSWTLDFKTSCSNAVVCERWGSYQGAALGDDRPVLAVRAAVALRPDFDNHVTPEHRQVPQPDRSVEPVKPVDVPATTMALGRPQGAFHLNQHRALLQYSVSQHAHVGQLRGHGQRDWHHQQSIDRDTRAAFQNLAPVAIPPHLVASTGNIIDQV